MLLMQPSFLITAATQETPQRVSAMKPECLTAFRGMDHGVAAPAGGPAHANKICVWTGSQCTVGVRGLAPDATLCTSPSRWWGIFDWVLSFLE